MINTVLFDLDGTLLDTTEGILESVKYTAKQLAYRELPYEKMIKFVGPPIQNSFIKYYGCDKETAQRAANIFRDYYKSKALLKAVPYEGIYELCEKLKQYDLKLAVATYKREDYALKLLKYFGFDKYCASMHGADNLNVLTKADIINFCMKETGGTIGNTVLVGDTVHDAKGAEKAGIRFIAVTYGFGFKTESDVVYPNIGIANSVAEIYEIFASAK